MYHYQGKIKNRLHMVEKYTHTEENQNQIKLHLPQGVGLHDTLSKCYNVQLLLVQKTLNHPSL